MKTFADTNWLEALYLSPRHDNPEATTRHDLVNRRMRRQSGPLLISQIVLLEARNVFSRTTGEPKPKEWNDLLGDINGRLFVDPLHWDRLRQETYEIIERFSHRITLGTFDATLLASARLAGAEELLTFDETLKAIATCTHLKVFPQLGPAGKQLLAALNR